MIEPVSAAVILNVQARQQPSQISISPDALPVSALQNASHTEQQIFVSNTAGGALQFNCQATTQASWLTIPSCSGSVLAGQSMPVNLTLDPSSPAAGTFSTQLAFHAGQTTLEVVVLSR